MRESQEDVKQIFPNAVQVRLPHKNGIFSGTCFVLFCTVAEAEAATKLGNFTILGQVVKARLSGDYCCTRFEHLSWLIPVQAVGFVICSGCEPIVVVP